MAARIVQVDLSRPLPELRAGRSCGALWVLVKFGLQPLGWVKIPTAQFGHFIAPETLARLISDALSPQIHDAARRRVFDAPSNEQTPFISLIVSTRENPEALERHLLSLARLQYANFETVVVDNAPQTDRAQRICEKFSFVHRVVEPRPGISYARNTGWQVARGEIIAYSEDSTIVDPNWLAILADDFASADVQCVAGVSLPSSLDPAAEKQFAAGQSMPLGFHQRRFFTGGWNSSVWHDLAQLGRDASISFRRSALHARQGFDAALSQAAALDLMTRIIRDGGDVLYDPRAICFSQRRQTFTDLRRRAFASGFGFATCCAKYFNDAELANSSANSLRQWAGEHGLRRFRENLAAVVRLQPHVPLQLILLELAGGIFATNAYRRSVRKLRNDTQRFRQKGIVRRAA